MQAAGSCLYPPFLATPSNHEEVSSGQIANTTNGRAKSNLPGMAASACAGHEQAAETPLPCKRFSAPETGVCRVLSARQLVALRIDALSRRAT